MNERDLFLAAIEIADRAERAAYLDQVCDGNQELRAQVEELLKTHAETSQFLETPAVATASSVDQAVPTDSSDTDHDPGLESTSAEAEFRKYLEPATRPGWLGRLAHYEIEKVLGCGAFGIVAKAFDEKLHRVVAIKLMRPEIASTSPPRKRFLREARTAAAVMHENIVAIYAVEEDPIPYLVMEYILGKTLQQRMNERGPLEVPELLRIGQQVAAGMAAAHAVNLIHRDIKPSNILLSDGPTTRVKISDFGLARAVDDATLTSSGLIAGTPMYMAPEQARGETLDHRADLFSLGSVLYQMAGGRPPFRAANTVAVLKRVCEDTPRPLGDVLPGTPGWLETIIFRLLEKERDDRYQTAQEVADLLACCQRELEHNGKVTCVAECSSAVETQVFQAKRSTGSGARRKPSGWLFGGVVAVAAVIGIVVMNGGNKTPDPDLTSVPGDTTSVSTTGTPASLAEPTGWRGWSADAPSPAIAAFDAEQAKAHQEAWAKHLGVPVEYKNSIGMKFRLIPPGEFLMGSTPEEIERHLSLRDGPNATRQKYWRDAINSEGPQQPTVLSQPFYLGMFEVTQAEYERVMGTNPASHQPTGKAKDLIAGIDTAHFPVEMVSWNDAIEFCNQLSQTENLKPRYFLASSRVNPLPGDGYHLPTEAQWEFACRAGATTPSWAGHDETGLSRVAWYNKNSGGRVHAVGELLPNPFGLYDMLGNVEEFCEDGCSADKGVGYQTYSPSVAIDPPATWIDKPLRILRGGDSLSEWQASRSAFRNRNYDHAKSPISGIRISLTVDAVRRRLQAAESTVARPVPTEE